MSLNLNWPAGLLLTLLPLVTACEQEMANQPRYEPYEPAPDWLHNQSALTPVPGTVARNEPLEPPAQQLPLPLDQALLERGRQRFEIFCTPCHGLTGEGNGMVVQRGFPAPPSLHAPHLRQAPLRHFYQVISEGVGVMYAYGARVAPPDRWAIAAYIRALQLSQHTPLQDLSPQQRARLEGLP